MTPFEKRLEKIPLRSVPEDWRDDILAVALKKHPKKGLLFLIPTLRELLWPHPFAWGALAACWLLIGGLNFSGPRGEQLYAVVPKGVTPLQLTSESYIAYSQQQMLLLRKWRLAEDYEESVFVPVDRSKL